MADPPLKLQKPPGYKNPADGYRPTPKPPPPRKPIMPPSFQPRRKQRRGGCRGGCCRRCCCYSFIIMLIICLLIVICAGLFYLWFDPKLPVFHLTSFKVSAFNVTSKLDGTYLNAVTLARVEVRNPNQKLTYIYGASDVEVTAGKNKETALGTTHLPAFTQESKNTTSLKIESSVKEEVINGGVGSRLLDEFSSGNLVVNVEVKTRVWLGVAGNLRIGMLDVHVLCAGITLKQMDGGQMPGCVINMLKWINLHS